MSEHDLEYEHPTNCICPECKSENWWVRFDDTQATPQTPPTATQLVQRVQGMELDDTVREGAISSLRDLTDDYEFATGLAGDLSGAEVHAATTISQAEYIRQIDLRHALYQYYADLFEVAPGRYEPQDIENLVEQGVSAVGEVAAAYKRIKERVTG